MVTTSYEKEDSLTKIGAIRLANQIKQFWKDKGKEIKMKVDDFTINKISTHRMFQIRSDMLKGLPRD